MARGRHTRFRGNVQAAGLRLGAGGDAARRGWPGARRRPPHPRHLAWPAPRSRASRRRLPLPGLRQEVVRRPPRGGLGGWRRHQPWQHGASVPSASSRGARGGGVCCPLPSHFEGNVILARPAESASDRGRALLTRRRDLGLTKRRWPRPWTSLAMPRATRRHCPLPGLRPADRPTCAQPPPRKRLPHRLSADPRAPSSTSTWMPRRIPRSPCNRFWHCPASSLCACG